MEERGEEEEKKLTDQEEEEIEEVDDKNSNQEMDMDKELKCTTQSEEEADEAHDDENDREEDEDDKSINNSEGEEEEEEGEGAAAAGSDDEEDMAAYKKKMMKVTDSKVVPGIIYLGHIPPRCRPKHLKNMLAVYGEIGRVFLQPEERFVRMRKKKSGLRRCDFTEGWVEFRDKRIAKRVAASLHNTPMGNKKRHRFVADLWSIKYLHRFQWTHLSEQLAYQRTVQQQRLRTEVSQARKETNFYLNNVEKSLHMDKGRKKRRKDGEQADEKTWDFTQRQTEEEIQTRKKKKDSAGEKPLEKARLIQQKSQSNVSLLSKIFNASKAE